MGKMLLQINIGIQSLESYIGIFVEKVRSTSRGICTTFCHTLHVKKINKKDFPHSCKLQITENSLELAWASNMVLIEFSTRPALYLLEKPLLHRFLPNMTQHKDHTTTNFSFRSFCSILTCLNYALKFCCV